MERQQRMIEDSPVAAIYARKSKATDKGESVENQINRCISLCEMRGWGYVVFVDYDYTGKNTDRPDFNLMMNGIKSGKYNNLVCYKLDRVSRSVNDFSSLIKTLEDYDAGFVSIKENFDTSTPMGRAMMMITAVFAQLERETIAERVRDNMIDRAKAGKWNGGPVPYGFNSQSETIEYRDRKKKVSFLVPDPEESEKVKEFYSWYEATGGSVRNVVTKANDLGYKTKNGSHWSHSQVSRILQNPIYAAADNIAFEHFSKTDVDVIDDEKDFTGEYGLMYYNRRKPHKNTTKERDQEDWILAIGEHKPIISGGLFVTVQEKLKNNKQQAPRKGQGIRSPLSGLVRCGKCGASMSVFASRRSNKKAEGYYNYFRCLTKEQQSKNLCDNGNVRADKLEDLVHSHIVGLLDNKKALKSILEANIESSKNNKAPLLNEKEQLEKKRNVITKEIDNLVDHLSKGTLPEKIIKEKYKQLENDLVEVDKAIYDIKMILDMNSSKLFNADAIISALELYKENYPGMSFDERKEMFRGIVRGIKINDGQINLELIFMPDTELGNHVDCSRMDKDSCLQQT